MPIATAWKLQDISLDDLEERQKKLILLDVDNTLTKWKSEEIDSAVIEWVNQAKSRGMKLCLLSNTRHPERLFRLAKHLDIQAIRGRMKPSRSMYLRALREYGVDHHEAIMIGDQILTDVFGANRSGIEAIWLHPIAEKEFMGTKVNRWIEDRIVRDFFAPLETPIIPGDAAKVGQGSIVRQILRFCVVGGVSFLIDTTISILLETVIKVHGELLSTIFGTWLIHEMPFIFGSAGHPKEAAAKIFFWVAALAAMTNSFILNRMWTFEIRGDAHRMSQMRKFFAVSLIGTGLNTFVASYVFVLLAGHTAQDTAIAKAAAAVVVAAWNFLGQRLYAFRQPKDVKGSSE